jgi:hypothetical protein
VLRDAASDLGYNSWRFIGANVLVGGLLLVIGLGIVATPVLLLLAPILVPPAAGMMRMATRLVRDGHTDFGDLIEVVRHPGRVLVVGTVQLLVTIVLVADVLIGGGIAGWIGTLLLVGALYGLLIGWAYVAVLWPLLLDPERDRLPLRADLRLALVVLVAHPIRVGGILLLIGVLLLVSGILIMPILTFSLALAWLVIARYVLPVADRIEGRATRTTDEG